MAQYSYRARNQAGMEVKGTLQAPNEERANALLQANGLIPLSINVAVESSSIFNKDVWGGKVSNKDLVLFSRQLSSMIRAGVPIVEALEALMKQSDKVAFKRLMKELSYDIEGGSSLSQALSKHADVFSMFFLGIVKTGEASGRLADSLATISEYLEQNYVFVRKIRSAMMYPAFVVAATVIIVILMFMFVMPQLVDLFNESNVQLPLPTRILMGVYNFFQNYWYLVLTFFISFGLFARWYLKTPEGQYSFSAWVLNIPTVRILFQKIYLARLTSILSTLLSSDVPVIESLHIARDSIDNAVYQRIMDETANAVKDGASLSTVWEYEENIPPMMTTMIAVGEQSGEIHKAFAEAYRFYRRDVDEALDTFAVFLEPVMVILLAIGVAIVVSAVILPIYNLVLVL